MSPFGQCAHFISHHRKAPALLAGPCSLDGGIERQQVGLFCDTFDDAKHRADVLDFRAQAFNARTGRGGRIRQLLDPRHALAHHMLTTFNLAVRRLRRHGGFLGVARDIVHGGRHLVHRGGDLLGFFLLAADFKVGLFSHRRQRLR
ncbi:hypothetical protein D3C81_697740 [compost metagenome]